MDKLIFEDNLMKQSNRNKSMKMKYKNLLLTTTTNNNYDDVVCADAAVADDGDDADDEDDGDDDNDKNDNVIDNKINVNYHIVNDCDGNGEKLINNLITQVERKNCSTPSDEDRQQDDKDAEHHYDNEDKDMDNRIKSKLLLNESNLQFQQSANSNINMNTIDNNCSINQQQIQINSLTITTTTTTTTTSTTTTSNSGSGCVHYKRSAKFVTPCCGKFYNCRFCHDENENHHFDRKTLTELICTKCDTRQKVQAECEKCGVRFGKYTCLVCNLFDDEVKNQYHCDGCGICRIGGRENFFHCNVCNMCLPIQLQTDGHKCVENISRSNCPVCLGDIHTSRLPCHIPRCNHLLHKICFDQLLASGHYVCPTCQTSMIDMKKLWNYLDTQATIIPVPKSYVTCDVQIFCNDCCKQSTAKFHFVGLKCSYCGGYNTSQNIKSRSRNWSNNPSTSA